MKGGASAKGSGTRVAKKREAEAGTKATSAMVAVSHERRGAGAKGASTRAAKKRKVKTREKATIAMVALSRERMGGAKGADTMAAKKHQNSGGGFQSRPAAESGKGR